MRRIVIRKIHVTFLFSFVIFIAACSSAPDPVNTAWLFGTWELSYNPENDDSDLLVFRDDGTVIVQTEHDQAVNGTYKFVDHDLVLSLTTSRKIVDVEFTISADKSRLNYHTGAYYTKRK